MKRIYLIIAMLVSATILLSSCNKSSITITADQTDVIEINLADSASHFLTGRVITENDYISTITASFFATGGNIVNLTTNMASIDNFYFGYSINSLKSSSESTGTPYDYTDIAGDIKRIELKAESADGLVATKTFENIKIIPISK